MFSLLPPRHIPTLPTREGFRLSASGPDSPPFCKHFFVHLADFLSHICDDGHAGVNHLSMRAAECAAGLGTGLL
jgi:hypothetical protein